MSKVTLSTRKYKVGYEVRDELCRTDFKAVPLSGEVDEETQEIIDYISTPSDVIVKSSYTPSGDYIGNSKVARYLIVKRGIKPEKRSSSSRVCSIGFCEAEQKWYGWSHRAIFGFGVGDTVKEGDCTNSSGYTEKYLAGHPDDDISLPIGFVAKDLIDAKRMAIAFADSVS